MQAQTRQRIRTARAIALAVFGCGGILCPAAFGQSQPPNALDSTMLPQRTEIKETTGRGNMHLEVSEVMPDCPYPLQQFLAMNIKYPKEALRNEKHGRVSIEAVIDTAGNITEPKIVDGRGYGMNEEALRVVKLLPKWLPGIQDGKRVAVIVRIPINCRLYR